MLLIFCHNCSQVLKHFNGAGWLGKTEIVILRSKTKNDFYKVEGPIRMLTQVLKDLKWLKAVAHPGESGSLSIGTLTNAILYQELLKE